MKKLAYLNLEGLIYIMLENNLYFLIYIFSWSNDETKINLLVKDFNIFKVIDNEMITDNAWQITGLYFFLSFLKLFLFFL